MRLKLAISPCPNDTFMFDALINGRIDTGSLEFDVSFRDIEHLNAGVMGARAGGESGFGGNGNSPGLDNGSDNGSDISKISYAVLPEIISRYRLLNSGSALGHGNGPLLVCRGSGNSASFVSKITQSFTPSILHRDFPRQRCIITANTTNHTENEPLRVAVPGVHTTANLLLQKLFPHLTDRRPVLFSEIAPAIARDEYDAGVLIHEGRFTYGQHGLELVADLGMEWERATGGLPLPLGAIVASRRLPPEIIKTVDDAVRRSVEYAFAHPEESREFVKSHARELDDRVIDSHIALFVNRNSLDLSREAKSGIRALTGVEVD